jgi:hypothetical protein
MNIVRKLGSIIYSLITIEWTKLGGYLSALGRFSLLVVHAANFALLESVFDVRSLNRRQHHSN